MKPVLLLQSRPENVASDDKYKAFLRFSGLEQSDLQRLRAESERPEINLDDYAAIIMGGGPANFAYPEDEKSKEQYRFEAWLLELIDKIIETDKPFLGACLGVGALVTALGGKMSFDYGEPVQATEIIKTESGKSDPLLIDLPAKFDAFVGHKEGVCQAPNRAVVLARSKTCIQMIRVGQNVYATQFHPELDAKGLALRIKTYKNAGYFAPDEADELIAAAHQANTDHAVKVLYNFVSRYLVSTAIY